MISDPILPDHEKAVRIEATSPALDAWVSANAGSGKTTILRNRVIRLLLDGVAPDRVLCLTFTKAAAAEMQARIFAELARWVGLDDATLTREIGRLVSVKPDRFTIEPRRLDLARTLFARAIEAPGGLKIQTIHAFAERVLHLFPLEAGVPLDFTVLGDADAEALRTAARRATVEAAIREPASPLGRAFGEILDTCGTDAFAKALHSAMRELSSLAMRDALPPEPRARDAAYRAALDVPAGETLERIEADFTDAAFSDAEMRAAAEAIRAPAKISETQAELAGEFLRVAQLRADGAPWQDGFLKLFLKADGDPKKAVFVKPALLANPELAAFEARAKAACLGYLERLRAFRTFTRSLALLIFAESVLGRFVAAKRARNALDFDDLIAALRRLLQSGQASWMMLKLDSSIEHVLVDEAQDTTREMWDILRGLTEEFFAGEGKSRRRRSLFVVGDEKQSIFSFQGADPVVFEESRAFFAQKSLEPALIKTPVALNSSFRSSDDILRAVDAVFAAGDRAEGLTASGLAIEHIAARQNFPGLVEIWPPERPEDEEAAEAGAPGHAARVKIPPVALAERIADQIADWLRTDARHLADGKPIRPGDIVILVQRRNRFFSAMLRALKRRKIPVAGADRLKLQDEIVIRDFLVIAEALLLEHDDLALATALRSPLFGLSERQLEDLARNRPGSLRGAVLASEDPALQRIGASLEALGLAVRTQSPFEFFASLLTQAAPGAPEMSGRKAILTRLGDDASDPIDAFLTEAQDFSRAEPGSVLLFVMAQRGRITEIKRDLDQGGNRVRVMTVHGAKGLEGRIVFLGDTIDKPDRAKERPAFLLDRNAPTPLLLWAGSKRDEPLPMREARHAERRKILAEYRRLLYVGMTRAADRLYVGGYAQKVSKRERDSGVELPPPEEAMEWSWYHLLRAGLADLPGMRDVFQENAAPPHLDERPVRRLVSQVPAAAPVHGAPAGMTMAEPLPRWLKQGLAQPARPLPPLRPSKGLVQIIPSTGEDGTEADLQNAFARRRGIVLHQLYEWLPRIDAEARSKVGRELLARLAPEIVPAEQNAVLAPVLAFLETADGLRLFGPHSRAEVAISGRIALPDGSGREVTARVDRLVVGETRVEIVDIKTGQPRKAGNDAVITRQMALYRAVLQAIYPEKTVDCLVLWSGQGRLDRLEQANLDQALERITTE